VISALANPANMSGAELVNTPNSLGWNERRGEDKALDEGQGHVR
jgi:hypothetical protein